MLEQGKGMFIGGASVGHPSHIGRKMCLLSGDLW